MVERTSLICGMLSSHWRGQCKKIIFANISFQRKLRKSGNTCSVIASLSNQIIVAGLFDSEALRCLQFIAGFPQWFVQCLNVVWFVLITSYIYDLINCEVVFSLTYISLKVSFIQIISMFSLARSNKISRTEFNVGQQQLCIQAGQSLLCIYVTGHYNRAT